MNRTGKRRGPTFVDHAHDTKRGVVLPTPRRRETISFSGAGWGKSVSGLPRPFPQGFELLTANFIARVDLKTDVPERRCPGR